MHAVLHHGIVAYTNSGCVEAITFCGDVVIWQSENDVREYCEECVGGYRIESIGEYVEKQYLKFTAMLNEGINNDE